MMVLFLVCHLELNGWNPKFFNAFLRNFPSFEIQLFQLFLEEIQGQSQAQETPNEHIPADP